MQIRDVIKPWPPNSGWTTSYQGTEILTPNPAQAVVSSARAESKGVYFAVAEGDRQFSTVLLLDSEALIQLVTKALTSAHGKTLDEAGAESLED